MREDLLSCCLMSHPWFAPRRASRQDFSTHSGLAFYAAANQTGENAEASEIPEIPGSRARLWESAMTYAEIRATCW